MNFAMHKELMNSAKVKMDIETWQSQILDRTKTSSAPLAKENSEIVLDLKQIWKTFNDLLQ